MEEKFGAGGTLGRETSGEVVLAPRLRAALEKLNPMLPPEAIAAAVEELSRDRTAMTLAGANRETWALVKDGVKVQVPDGERGGAKDERVRVVDWENPEANVLTDEAHRSQYDTLAMNMHAALPKALFLAFTGTPLIAGEERTQDVFGDYVSIYDFQQSIEDGATVRRRPSSATSWRMRAWSTRCTER